MTVISCSKTIFHNKHQTLICIVPLSVSFLVFLLFLGHVSCLSWVVIFKKCKKVLMININAKHIIHVDYLLFIKWKVDTVLIVTKIKTIILQLNKWEAKPVWPERRLVKELSKHTIPELYSVLGNTKIRLFM